MRLVTTQAFRRQLDEALAASDIEVARMATRWPGFWAPSMGRALLGKPAAAIDAALQLSGWG